MKTIAACGIVGVVALIAGCSLGPSEKPGFKPLFNGRDLSGWIVKCKPRDLNTTYWSVNGGTILADSVGRKDHDYVWLTTVGEYGDFVLRLKFQAYHDSPGNSGVQFRSRYDDAESWLDGPQVDINPPGAWRTGMIWDETRGNRRWLYPDLPADKWVNESMTPPNLRFRYNDDADNWNDLELTATGTKISALLNGVPVTDYDGKGILDDPVHAQRRVGMKGVIALQIHAGDELRIRFKDIRIKELRIKDTRIKESRITAARPTAARSPSSDLPFHPLQGGTKGGSDSVRTGKIPSHIPPVQEGSWSARHT